MISYSFDVCTKLIAIGAAVALASTVAPVQAQTCSGSAVLRTDPGVPAAYVLPCTEGLECCIQWTTGDGWVYCSCDENGMEPPCCHMEVSIDHSMKQAQGECGGTCGTGLCSQSTGGNTTIATCNPSP